MVGFLQSVTVQTSSEGGGLGTNYSRGTRDTGKGELGVRKCGAYWTDGQAWTYGQNMNEFSSIRDLKESCC
jgi:hypothetical protein